MQPNDQRGYWQPEPVQPPQSVTPPPSPLRAQPMAAPVAQQPQQQPIAPAPAPLPGPQYSTQPSQPLSPVMTTDIPRQAALSPVQQPIAPVPQAIPQQYDAQQQPAEDEEYYEDELDENEEPAALTAPVNWEAQEYIHQEKGTVWFIIFGVVLAVMIGVAVWQQAWTFVLLLIVIATTIIVFAKRPPRVISYSLTDKGLSVDDTLHPFKNFKSFGVVRDGEEYSIMLIPTKRFQPGVTVYFPEASGEAIVDMLGARLPMRELHLDVVDRFVRKIRL
ncbi:hypothetical protein A2791_03445 [Candidatus Saccharibacteria bacterium RIFCSPHIGHO2_01_FULL_46_30]|nr:MAG: hypothetical protein A2791_03445 [Candidatus Saccharibacteria bacterium RIFCSPHIGHO2_01_FULL_46_30]